jgi:hypothetical protein
MTDRCSRVAVFALAVLCFAAPAGAGVVSSALEGVEAVARSVARDIKRRNCWPEPFDAPDRYAVRSPFGVMVDNGWRRQNLLGDYHFVDQGGELTEAARIKIRWIVTEAPVQHRTIYVQAASNPQLTAARIDSVQQLTAQLGARVAGGPGRRNRAEVRGFHARPEAAGVRCGWRGVSVTDRQDANVTRGGAAARSPCILSRVSTCPGLSLE